MNQYCWSFFLLLVPFGHWFEVDGFWFLFWVLDGFWLVVDGF